MHLLIKNLYPVYIDFTDHRANLETVWKLFHWSSQLCGTTFNFIFSPLKNSIIIRNCKDGLTIQHRHTHILHHILSQTHTSIQNISHIKTDFVSLQTQNLYARILVQINKSNWKCASVSPWCMKCILSLVNNKKNTINRIKLHSDGPLKGGHTRREFWWS